MGYCTRAALKEWLGNIDDEIDDLKLDLAIDATTQWIDEHCDRSFAQLVEARVFDADSFYVLCVDDLVSVTTLKTDGNLDGTFETTWSASDYQKLPVDALAGSQHRPYTKIRAIAGRTFPLAQLTGRVGLVEVTGTWGWPTVPAAVEQACLIQSARVYKRHVSPEGVTGWQSDFGPIRVSVRVDPDVEALLAPYRRHALRVA